MKPTFSANFKSDNVDKELVNHVQYISRDLYDFMSGLLDMSNLPFQIRNSLVYIGFQSISFSWQDSNRKRKIIGVFPIMTNGAKISDTSSEIIKNGVKISFNSDLQVYVNFMLIGE